MVPNRVTMRERQGCEAASFHSRRPTLPLRFQAQVVARLPERDAAAAPSAAVRSLQDRPACRPRVA